VSVHTGAGSGRIAVEAVGLTKQYVMSRTRLFGERNKILAVDDASFQVPDGTTFGLVGESGSGKSTIAKMLLKLEAPTVGKLIVEGKDIFTHSPTEQRRYRQAVQTVFQDPYGSLSPRLKVGTIVAEPLVAQTGMSWTEAQARARETLKRVGMSPDVADRYPHQLSGGQRQRIGIARAISVNPRLLVLDEPVSALDVSIRAQILKLLRSMQEEMKLTYLFIGHDLAIVRYLSDWVGVMYFGRIVEIGPASEVLQRPLHPYTIRLVEVARADTPLRRNTLSGTLPNPLKPPSGCQFRTRCPFADIRCVEEKPALRQARPDHQVSCHHFEAIESERKAESGPMLDDGRSPT
jgi:oligopeptide/dipeptide ABC transporter ATP-binding protein